MMVAKFTWAIVRDAIRRPSRGILGHDAAEAPIKGLDAAAADRARPLFAA